MSALVGLVWRRIAEGHWNLCDAHAQWIYDDYKASIRRLPEGGWRLRAPGLALVVPGIGIDEAMVRVGEYLARSAPKT